MLSRLGIGNFSLSLSLSLPFAPQPSLGLGLLHKIQLNFLEASQQFSFSQGRVVSPTPNPPPWRTRRLYLYYPEAGWLPILVASYDTHGLRWDYSYSPDTTRENREFPKLNSCSTGSILTITCVARFFSRRWTGLLGCDAVRGCIQKFPDWPPGASTANGTALRH
jgi:hypothetical protein